MKRLKLYLDTSIFNFALANKMPKEQEVTQNLLNEIKNGQYEAFISEIVLQEIGRAQEEKAKDLIKVIRACSPMELKINSETNMLAEYYVHSNIIPRKYFNDALHIAVATVHIIDAIISWNFEHIVKLKTKREIVGINIINGYKEIEIYSPWEVVSYD